MGGGGGGEQKVRLIVLEGKEIRHSEIVALSNETLWSLAAQ